jgi:thymidylate synthase (FAD)
VRFICDRGVSHEIVRHRLASYSQESTRFCNYVNENFGSEITFIEPCFWSKDKCVGDVQRSYCSTTWEDAMVAAEAAYFELIRDGAQPQEARSVLPNSLKTEIVVTMNLREWRHFFKLRAAGTAGRPHPQMLELTIPLLGEFKQARPVVFDDIMPMEG